MAVPTMRIADANGGPVNAAGDYVLYWMTAARRPTWNFAIDRAAEWGTRLGKPLVVLEALRHDYPWASDRLHTFVLQGMADNARHFGRGPALYYPYIELAEGEGKGLLAALAERASVVVTDRFPAFFLPRMTAAAAAHSPVLLERVDSNGLLPLAASDHAYPTAFAFRAFLQKQLPPHLAHMPREDALAGAKVPTLRALPPAITTRWPLPTPGMLPVELSSLRHLRIDHRVAPVTSTRGGCVAARATLDAFLDQRLARYADERNQPGEDVASGLSPYLHFGHLSAHEVFASLMTRERWTTRSLGASRRGARDGWWGATRQAEAFLDELVTWRELGYNMCHHRADYDRYESLPAWAQSTLAAHAADERTHCYSLEEFEGACTHDPLWNAAQRQLSREGRIHNYLRMLWGKKILEWSASPRDALAIMIELNNKYALDGRDPNSYSGIFWVLGRYDRPWAPERAVFGRVRYMSSENTARKVRVREYLARYSGATMF